MIDLNLSLINDIIKETLARKSIYTTFSCESDFLVWIAWVKKNFTIAKNMIKLLIGGKKCQ